MSQTMRLYLDHNATSPLDPRVLEAMLPHLQAQANASSLHAPGRAARAALEQAREQVAALVDAHSSQVVFTSGGTEANNLALRGVLGSALARGVVQPRLVFSAIEHDSVRAQAHALGQQGARLQMLAVDFLGRVQAHALADDTALVSVMLANNETGVIQDLAPIVERAAALKVPLHADAAQAAGRIPVSFRALGVQLLTLSAHKMQGPQGVGALIVDKSLDLQPQSLGGAHERGRRAGTENIAAIVGFGKAAELAKAELMDRARDMRARRDQLEAALVAMPGWVILAAEAERLPNTTLASCAGIDGETLLLQLDAAGLAVSSGSACHSDRRTPSPVLEAMGVPSELARSTVRLSLSPQTTAEEIDFAVQALRQVSEPLRSPAFQALAF
jgi:cysteine desulfurase